MHARAGLVVVAALTTVFLGVLPVSSASAPLPQAAAGTVQGNPELADLVTRFYRPSEPEAQRIAGMSLAAFEERANRTEQFMKDLAAIDRDSLDTADRNDYDYFHAGQPRRVGPVGGSLSANDRGADSGSW